MSQNRDSSTHQHFAKLLDSRFKIPNTDIRFGLDAVVGLIPGAGDWLGGVASLYFILHAAALKAKSWVLLRMLMNILIDIIIGTIPLVGEIFDVGWKANLKNAELLNELKDNPQEAEQQSMLVVWGISLLAVISVFMLLFVIGWVMISVIEAIL